MLAEFSAFICSKNVIAPFFPLSHRELEKRGEENAESGISCGNQ